MNKTTKIIIAFGIAILLAASVFVISLVKTNSDDDKKTSAPIYTLQPTTLPSIPAVTESWVDLNMIASNLATATDPNATSTTMTNVGITQVVIPNGYYNVTSIVYVDQFGNPIDFNQITQNNQTTETTFDNSVDLQIPVTTTEPEGALSEYEVNSSGVITGYYGGSNVVIIPPRVNGKTVVGIGDNCFKGSRIKSVQIPETVKSIGNSAFQDCRNLTTVVFANSTVDVTIGISAFRNCESLKSINLPITSSIGMSAFEGCSSLESIDIKKGCKSIGQFCFALCPSLTKVTIRDEQTTLGGLTTFQEHNPELIVYCVSGSATENNLKDFGLNTAPISQ